MDSPSEAVGAKAAFRKPSNDPSNRKYRHRSPVSGSSSSDGEPVRERSSTPTHSLNDNNRQRKDDWRDRDRDHKRNRYSRDSGSNRNPERRSYNDRRHDDFKRREKYADKDQKNFHKVSSRDRSEGSRRELEQNRSRDRSDGSRHKSRDKDRVSPRGHRSGHHHHHHRDTSCRDSKELDDPKYARVEKGKSYDQETTGRKDRHFKEPRELLDDKSVLAARKSKFSEDRDTEYNKDALKHVTVANEVQSSSSKYGQDFVGKANADQEFVKDSGIDAAKIAAMKAAELVNRNLIGTGIMSTDQKKKLLWGSKKSTPTEEAARRWDTSMFSDRERQEKFNKLMSLRLHWYHLLWPLVGCEGGSETRGPRHQSCRKTERASDGLGETIHCWSSPKGWTYGWFRALKLTYPYYGYVLYLLLLLSYAARDVFLLPHDVKLLC